MGQFHQRWNAALPVLAAANAKAADGRGQIHHSLGFLRVARRADGVNNYFDQALVSDLEIESSFQGGAVANSRQAYALGVLFERFHA